MQTENYKGMTINYEDKMVHLVDDQALRDFLAQPENGTEELAKHIKEQYKAYFQKELNIAEESLAIEIIGHIYSSKIGGLVEKAKAMIPKEITGQADEMIQNIQGEQAQIDMGEADVDSNRKIWDALVPAKGIIFMLVGQNA